MNSACEMLQYVEDVQCNYAQINVGAREYVIKGMVRPGQLITDWFVGLHRIKEYVLKKGESLKTKKVQAST